MNLPIVHGVPFSQPVRAVVWLLLLKEKPFEFLLVDARVGAQERLSEP